MNEDKSISDFKIRLCGIVNTFFSLGEKMFEEKLARKILRSLPKKFGMKARTIEEAQDLRSVKVNKLICSLQTFEMDLNDKFENKNNGITFVSNVTPR